MGIIDTLYTVAKDRIWANQHADRNSLFELKLISRFEGVSKIFSTPAFYTHLPDYEIIINNLPTVVAPKEYQIYVVGGFNAEMVGVDANENLANWISIDSLITTCKLFGLIFSNYRLLDPNTCYLRITPEGLMIVAIERITNSSRLKPNSAMFLRLYSNSDTENIGYSGDYYSEAAIVNNTSAYNAFKSQFDLSINSFAFMEGFYMPKGFPITYSTIGISPLNMQYYVDPEIIANMSFSKSDMLSFTHEGEEYYLLSSKDDPDTLVDEGKSLNIYCDDLEFFISGEFLNKGISNDYTRYGVYISRKGMNYINQLTFKDWIIKKSHLEEIENILTTEIPRDVKNIQIHVIVRRSGNNYFYVQDSYRTPDIMNLPFDIRQEVFQNQHPFVSFWNAVALMDNPLKKFLEVRKRDLDISLMTEMFSSYGAVEILEKIRWDDYEEEYRLPVMTHGQGWLIRFIDGLKDETNDNYYTTGTAVSQDIYPNGLGNEIWLPDVNSTDNLDIQVFEGDTYTLIDNDDFGIFCYYLENTNLLMATYETDYTYETYSVNPIYTKIVWKAHMYNKNRWVRKANTIIKYSKTLTAGELVDGWNIYNGRNMIHDVGMQKSLIWFRGKYLIENLDYVKHENKVYIIGKWDWQDDPGTDKVEVIYAGLPDSSLHHSCNDEWGFIGKGKLSTNSKYDLYNNRHRLIVANGRVLKPEEIYAAENYEEFNTIPLDEVKYPNGTPYAFVNLPRFHRKEELETISVPEHSDQLIDNAIESFLSSIYPEENDSSPIIISSKYDVYSLFMNKIIDEIYNNTLVINSNTYTDEQITAMVEPYIDLLEVDACNMNLPSEWVDIHPIRGLDQIITNINILWFVQQINRIFLYNRVKYINYYLVIQVGFLP
jgi:hypothetical protein